MAINFKYNARSLFTTISSYKIRMKTLKTLQFFMNEIAKISNSCTVPFWLNVELWQRCLQFKMRASTHWTQKKVLFYFRFKKNRRYWILMYLQNIIYLCVFASSKICISIINLFWSKTDLDFKNVVSHAYYNLAIKCSDNELRAFCLSSFDKVPYFFAKKYINLFIPIYLH